MKGANDQVRNAQPLQGENVYGIDEIFKGLETILRMTFFGGSLGLRRRFILRRLPIGASLICPAPKIVCPIIFLIRNFHQYTIYKFLRCSFGSAMSRGDGLNADCVEVFVQYQWKHAI